MAGLIHVLGRSGALLAHKSMTAPNARSLVTEKWSEVILRRNLRERWSASSGKIARRSGSIQYIASSAASSAIGKIPCA